MVLALERPLQTRRTKQAVIDCDIHISTPRNDPLGQYMSARWRRHHEVFGGPGRRRRLSRMNPAAARTDSWPPNGNPPGSDSAFLQQQLLDAWDIEYGVLNRLPAGGQHAQPGVWAQPSPAPNDWQIAEWLDRSRAWLRAGSPVREWPDFRRRRSTASATTRASCSLLMATRTASRWAGRSTGRSTRRPRPRPAARHPLSAAEGAARSPVPAGRPTTSKTTPAVGRPPERTWPASSSKASSSASRRSRWC